MKYVDEFRDSRKVRECVDLIHSLVTKPWTIMEVCGGQTHAILKWGLHELIPESIEIIHGPGCPVCVTPLTLLDHALYIASMPNCIFCSFGDMLRVPGSRESLLSVKAQGADIRIVYSPMEAVQIAQENRDKRVVFFGIGFETTAPANALAVFEAKRRSISNFSLLAANMLVPPALSFLLQEKQCTIQGFLAAGHVCTVMGYQEYEQFSLPIAVTGFEPLDILQGIYACILMLEDGKRGVVNQYPRAVCDQGNSIAKKYMNEVFEVVDRQWRGIGMIPNSGLSLQEAYADFDAVRLYPQKEVSGGVDTACISGLVLQGRKKPGECPLFGIQCTPETPCGAPMVSSEGACAAYYHYCKRCSGCDWSRKRAYCSTWRWR